MLDHFHIPTPNGAAEVFTFVGVAGNGGTQDGGFAWQKPRGKSMIDILLVGKGGNGGNGAVGANSTAAGGGGGASGVQVRVTMPLALLPDTLFISLAGIGTTNSGSTISIGPINRGAIVANQTIAFASGGNNGGNASGATAGAAGTAPSSPTATSMSLGWAFAQVLSGQAGIIGGVAVAGGALTLPTTGLLVTGGTGGGGLPAAAASGTAGGNFTVPSNSLFPAHAGGAAQATATNPGNPGSHGYRPIAGFLYGYGGAGGGSSHGSATGAGLFGGNGGDGAPGCGGGGGGGCLTGGTAGVGGLGGPAFCLITCW